MADAVVTVSAVLSGQSPASVADEIANSGLGPREVSRRALDQIDRALHGAAAGNLRVRVDGTTAVQASGTCVADVSDATAGDTLTITVPGQGVAVIAVTAATHSPTAGTVAADAADDAAFAAQIAACFNQHPFLKKFFTATVATATVTVTCRDDQLPGTMGNGVRFVETADSNSPFAPTSPAGGTVPAAAPSATITLGAPDVANDDTISIGSVTLTWKASAATEDEVTSSATEATAAANLTAKINAHSKLRGLVLATRATAVVTLTWLGDPRSGQLLTLARAETNSGSVVLSAAALASGSTESYGGDARSFTLGMA